MDTKKIPEDISCVADSIVSRFHPEKIYLFSNKRGGVGKTAGFKLCVIIESDDMSETERRIYLEIDCDVPFDVVLYSPENWEETCARKGSLAQRIKSSGVLVYG